MRDENDIIHQQRLLSLARRNVRHLVQQVRSHGGINKTPLSTLNDLEDNCAEIASIKKTLDSWGVQVEDHPDDFAPAPRIPLDSQEVYFGRLTPQRTPSAQPWASLISIGLLVMLALGTLGYYAYRAVNPDPTGSGSGDSATASPADQTYTRATLVTATGRDIQPSFSKDGKTLVFISDRDGNQEIYTLDMATRQEKRLTNTPDINEDLPSFFDDDRKIIYGGYPIGSTNDDIFIMNADGTDASNLTNTPATGEGRASFSRSGAYVVYDSNQTGTWEIYRARLSPANQLEDVFQITDRPGYEDRFAHFSPLENQILFRSEVINKGSGTSGIYLINIDGEKIENITLFTESFPDYYPMFSPNGKTIVFASKKSRLDGIYFYPVTAALPPPPPPGLIIDSEAEERYPSFATHGGGRILVFSSDEKAKDDFDIYALEFPSPFP